MKVNVYNPKPLSKRMRAMVVELLRCSADLATSGNTFPAVTASSYLDISPRLGRIAVFACRVVHGDHEAQSADEHIAYMLEVALRVERGEVL